MAALSRYANPMFPIDPNGMGNPPNHAPYQIPPHYHQQPAPRQRTAIACRYCRRRKIRCSGFETSPDGRCANCMRFNQECIFTPVSTQQGPVQAFVPAPHGILGHEQRLYGAQGQLLPVGYHSGAEYPRAGPSDSSQYSSLPNLSQHQHQQHHMNGNLSYMPHDDRGHSSSTPGPGHRSDSVYGTDRRRSDDYTHHYPPPSPSSHLPAPLGHAYAPSKNGSSNYSMSSYGGASESYNNIQPLHHGRPSSQRQDSPGSHRSSSGEHNSVSPQPHQTYHPPIASHRRDRETSSGPSSPGGQIPSMQIADLIDQPQGRLHQRSAADGDMLNRLNFRTGL